MTGHDVFDATVGSWLDDTARAPIPADTLDGLLAAIATRRPRSARLAGLGSHWIADPSSVSAQLGIGRIRLPALSARAAILLLLLTLVVMGAAVLAGSQRLAAPPELGRLVYEVDGVIYLADADGSDPTRVGDGYLQQTTMTGSVWSPDGRHFVYHGDGKPRISDANGRLVASLASTTGGSFSVGPYWSPDSSRLNQWTSDTRINVYGIDGGVQASLVVPEGYRRLSETEGVWAPDGRSVLVRIRQSDAMAEVWQLPIDRSAPQQVADDHPFVLGRGAFSPDGRQVAYVTNTGAGQLFVANADGSNARRIVQPATNDLPGFTLVWSPDGERLAYFMSGDLVVLEVATGTVSTAVGGFGRGGYPPFSWSSASDKLLFAAPGDGGGTSLWSVNLDGTGRRLLVAGSTWGAMPPPGANRASLIRIAGIDVSIALPADIARRVPGDGEAGNGIGWRNYDERNGLGSWTAWYLYAPGDIDDPSRDDDGMLPLPDDPVAWLRQLPGVTVLAERDIEVGGQPARLLDVSLPGEGGGAFRFEVPVGDSGSTRAFEDPGGTYNRYVIWRLGETWMVAQGRTFGSTGLEIADAPGDPFMQFIADLRFP